MRTPMAAELNKSSRDTMETLSTGWWSASSASMLAPGRNPFAGNCTAHRRAEDKLAADNHTVRTVSACGPRSDKREHTRDVFAFCGRDETSPVIVGAPLRDENDSPPAPNTETAETRPWSEHRMRPAFRHRDTSFLHRRSTRHLPSFPACLSFRMSRHTPFPLVRSASSESQNTVEACTTRAGTEPSAAALAGHRIAFRRDPSIGGKLPESADSKACEKLPTADTPARRVHTGTSAPDTMADSIRMQERPAPAVDRNNRQVHSYCRGNSDNRTASEMAPANSRHLQWTSNRSAERLPKAGF